MAHSIQKNIQWRDLVPMSKRESIQEVLLSLPWLLLSLTLAHYQFYFFALGASFMFFMVGLRQVHDAFHQALGLTLWGNHLLLYLLGLLMLGSMRAVKVNHLRHHRYCLEEDDIEGKYAKMSWWKALFLFSPIYFFYHHYKALQYGNKNDRHWIIFELLSNAIILFFVFFILDYSLLIYHYIAMIIGQLLSVFFAVWTVHHGAEDHIYMARTIRHSIKSNITYQLFYHVEHHLFPAVPTKRLPILAKRIDAYQPDLEKRMVY